jgi:protein-disulfide isomerase
MQLLIYGDYECPYTRRALIQVPKVREELGDDFVLVFRNFPLVEIHPHALHSAEAAEAAGQQGKFWDMHDLLFANQRALTDTDLLRHATKLGLDEARFIRDRDSDLVKSKIGADVHSGESSGVRGTPTFFVNGRFYRDSFDPQQRIPALKTRSDNSPI